MAAAARIRLRRGMVLSLALSLAVLIGLALTSLLLRPAAPPDPRTAFPAGEIIVGVDASFPPFALDDGGFMQGLDIDLVQAIADELELPIRLVNIGFYGLHDALYSGQVDILISALRVDPARMDDLRYTRAYFDNGLVLVQSLGAAAVVMESPAEARIAYEYASSADSQIRLWEAESRQIHKLPYELPQYALDALRLELAEAAIVDATTLRLYLRERSDWNASADYLTRDPYAIAVRIDRAEAWKLVDAALAALIESGEVARIIDKWL